MLRLILKVRKNSQWLEYADSFLIAIILALVIRTLVVQTFIIPSGSMEKSLLIGDQLIVNKFLYGTQVPWSPKIILKIRDPKRGDIIVFKYPKDLKTPYIKRCIGVPGDTIAIENKTVFVNGIALREPYAYFGDSRVLSSGRDNLGLFVVPPGQYFMLGDNRDFSSDSRFWGLLPRHLIEGKAMVIYWPFIRWRLI
ncbi:signal peptidase I [bacterium]|nr:signal peptidase I [bacterium]